MVNVAELKAAVQNPTVQLAVCVALVAILGLSYLNYARGKVHLPGPWPYPVFGNLPQLGADAALTFQEWAKTYGDVFKVTLGEREVIIINSAQGTKELLSDQGSAYIDRPVFHNFHGVMSSSAGNTIGTSPWDESCKRKRKAAATALNKVNVDKYVPIIDRETLAMIEDIYVQGKGGAVELDPKMLMARFALNTSLGVNYGIRLADLGDDLLTEIITVENLVSNVRSVTGDWSDYVPILRQLKSKEKIAGALEARGRRDAYMNMLLEDLKGNIRKGTDVPCITGSILKDPEAKLTPIELSSICLSMVSAGLDTLANTMHWGVGFLAKPENQHIWEKTYQEVLETYGGGVPDAASEACGYVTGLYRESARWFSVLKLSLPRQTLGESTYTVKTGTTNMVGTKVTIPSGVTTFLSAWSVHHDPKRYPEVDKFLPERHVQEKEEGGNVAHYSFGVGRRMCIGVHLANREMYAAFAKLAFFYKLEMGSEDYDINPETACENTYGLSCAPKTFKIRFVPRDPETIEQWIEDEKSRNEIQIAGSLSNKKHVLRGDKN